MAALILGSCVVILPVLILAVFKVWKRMPKILVIEEAMNFLWGASLALEMTFILSELIKNTYGRLRPDYLSRCFGNDKSLWPHLDVSKMPPIPDCIDTGIKENELLDGRKSFPSSHTSLSFAVYGYLALFIHRKLCQIKNTGSLRLVAPTLILCFPLFIGITRTQGRYGMTIISTNL